MPLTTSAAFCPEDEAGGAFWHILNNVQHVDFELAQQDGERWPRATAATMATLIRWTFDGHHWWESNSNSAQEGDLGGAASGRNSGGATCASSLSDGRKAGPQHEPQFAADTAKVTGESKSQINRHVARAEALGDDLPRVTGTSLDKGVDPLDF